MRLGYSLSRFRLFLLFTNVVVVIIVTKGAFAMEGFVQIQIPSSYLTPVNAAFSKIRRDCAFECQLLKADCTAFSFEDGECHLMKVAVPAENSSFVPDLVTETEAQHVLIKKEQIKIGAKKGVTHIGFLDHQREDGKVYDLVVNDQSLMNVVIKYEVEGPYFALHTYKNRILVCGGIGDKQCR